MSSLLTNFFTGDFKSFKDDITSTLYTKLSDAIETNKITLANDMFNESEEIPSNHADENGYPEGQKKKSDPEAGGEFLVDLKFVGGNATELKNFRVVGTNESDIESRLNGFFGKGKFEIKNIKMDEEIVTNIKYDHLKSLPNKVLSRAEYSHYRGDKDRAKHFLTIASGHYNKFNDNDKKLFNTLNKIHKVSNVNESADGNKDGLTAAHDTAKGWLHSKK